MLNNLSTISNCGVQKGEEISFMSQFLIFWGGRGGGGVQGLNKRY